jgi:hypothetical protein
MHVATQRVQSRLGALWRSGRESNPHSRICSPLHHHSATGPAREAAYIGSVRPSGQGWSRFSALAAEATRLYKPIAPLER